MKKSWFLLLLLALSYTVSFSQEAVLMIEPNSESAYGTWKRISGDFSEIKGKHDVYIRWKNHSLSVQNIYFDQSDETGIEAFPAEENHIYLNTMDNSVFIHNHQIGDRAFIYDLSGKLIDTLILDTIPYSKEMQKGFFIIRIKGKDKALSSHKIII